MASLLSGEDALDFPLTFGGENGRENLIQISFHQSRQIVGGDPYRWSVMRFWGKL